MSGPASAPDPSVMWGDAGTRIVLVRHGEPEDGPDCGPDPGLTDLGRRQAAAMAAVVGNEAIDAVYVSGQRRAQETGEALAAALGLTANVEVRVSEFDYGMAHYVSPRAAVHLSDEERLAVIAKMRDPAFAERVRAGIDDIVAAHTEQTVAVVCHGVVIGTIVRHLTGAAELKTRAKHTSVARLRHRADGEWELEALNEAHWLAHVD